MLPMRDGVRLNTFVYLPSSPEADGGSFPVILHRTPYGITDASSDDPTDYRRGWLPEDRS